MGELSFFSFFFFWWGREGGKEGRVEELACVCVRDQLCLSTGFSFLGDGWCVVGVGNAFTFGKVR